MFSSWTSRLTHRSTHEPPTRRRSSLVASQEDVNHLQLPPTQVRVLKKTLFHFSRLYTEIRDHDIFVVSWDVHNVPKPPDDLSAVLPPEAWEEPEIIVLGFRNVIPEFIESWIAVCDVSVARYALDFQPLVDPTKTLIEGGTLLLIYAKRFILPYVQHIDNCSLSSSFSAVCCRFCLHQAPICIVNVDLNDSLIGMVNDGDGADLDVRMALQHQQFKTLIERVHFDVGGRLYDFIDHPVVIILGCKDLSSNSEEQTEFQFPILRRLNSLDLRFCPNISGQVGVRRFRGAVDVVKAGAMRLVMEVDGGEGSRTAAPEVSMLRVGVPSVDAERLRHLYRSVWRSLKSGEEESAAVKIDPPIIELPPIRPFVPANVKFVIRNCNKTPVVFSVLCLRDSGRNMVPVSTQSFLHRAKLGQSYSTSIPPKTPRSDPQQIEEENRVHRRKSDASVMSIAMDMQKKFIGLKKKADRNLQGLLTRRTMTQSADSCSQGSKYLTLPKPGESAEDTEKVHHRLLSEEKTSKQGKGWWGRLGWLKRSHHEELSGRQHSEGNPEYKDGGLGGETLASSSFTEEKSLIGFDDTGWRTHREQHQITPESTRSTSYPSSPNAGSAKSSKFGSQSSELHSTIVSSDRIQSDPADSKIAKQHTEQFEESYSEQSTTELQNSQPSSRPANVPLLSIKIPGIELPKREFSQLDEFPSSSKPFDLTRWLLVEPSEGVVLSGNDIEVSVTILVKEGVMEEIDIPSLILAVRLDNCKVDSFFSLSTKVVPALHGLSMQQLESMGYRPFREDKIEKVLTVPYEETSPEDASVIPRSQRQLPVPKELWWILSNIYERTCDCDASIPEKSEESAADSQTPRLSSGGLENDNFRLTEFLNISGQGNASLTNKLKAQIKTVLMCIERGAKIPTESIPVIALLLAFEKLAMELPIPIMPRECVTDLSNDPSHLLCRAVLLSLPMWTRNLLIAILSLCRHLISRELKSRKAPEPNRRLLNTAIIEWLRRLLLRDTRTELSIPFLIHFINDSNMFNE